MRCLISTMARWEEREEEEEEEADQEDGVRFGGGVEFRGFEILDPANGEGDGSWKWGKM